MKKQRGFEAAPQGNQKKFVKRGSRAEPFRVKRVIMGGGGDADGRVELALRRLGETLKQRRFAANKAARQADSDSFNALAAGKRVIEKLGATLDEHALQIVK